MIDRECIYCGICESQTTRVHERDHFIPRARGGAVVSNNIVTACRHCNQLKANILFPSVDVCRRWLIRRYWQSERFADYRRLAFRGMNPEQYDATLRANGKDIEPMEWTRYSKHRRNGALAASVGERLLACHGIRVTAADWTLMKIDADEWTDGNVSMLLRLAWRAYREQRLAIGAAQVRNS